jgi:hypothetical protein
MSVTMVIRSEYRFTTQVRNHRGRTEPVIEEFEAPISVGSDC